MQEPLLPPQTNQDGDRGSAGVAAFPRVSRSSAQEYRRPTMSHRVILLRSRPYQGDSTNVPELSELWLNRSR